MLKERLNGVNCSCKFCEVSFSFSIRFHAKLEAINLLIIVLVTQLSFTIKNLFEGIEGNEALNFNLQLRRVFYVGVVFRDTLQHLFDTKDKLEVRCRNLL